MSCQVPPPWGLDFWVPGPPNLGLTLPWSQRWKETWRSSGWCASSYRHVPGGLGGDWPVSLCRRRIGQSALELLCDHHRAPPAKPAKPWAKGSLQPPAASHGQEPVLCAGSQQKQVAVLCHLAAHFKSDYWMPRSSHL